MKTQGETPELMPGPLKPGLLALRIALFFIASFLLVGTMMPYFPVWLDWKGLTTTEIAIVVALPMIVRTVFTPLVSFHADRTGDVRQVLLLLAWGALGAVVLLWFADGFWPILFAALLFALFWTTIMPLNEVIALQGARNAGLDYGRVRLWGSLAFIVASWGGGYIVDEYGAASVPVMLVGAAVLVVVAAFILPPPEGRGRLQAATAGPAIRLGDALRLVRQPLFIVFVLAGSFAQASHALYYSFGTLHWLGQGYSSAEIGALWMIGVLAEVLLFVWARMLLARIGPLQLLLIGSVGAIVRWSLTAQDPAFAVLVPLQALHGLTFGASHLGAIYFISTVVPERLASTAQGVYAALSGGLVIGLAIIASGPLYFGFASNAFFAMAMLGLVSAVLCLWASTLVAGGKRLD